MKKVGVVIAAILIIGLACGGFYLYKENSKTDVADTVDVSDLDKIIEKDLTADYPETPREVVKFYNRILAVYYGESYSEDEFEQLADQALLLFDDELLANNPRTDYIKAVKDEISSYKTDSKSILQTYVCDSNDVEYVNDGGDELAYVDASYFIKDNKQFEKTYEQYVLRKDSDDKWKILGYYKVEGDSSEEDE